MYLEPAIKDGGMGMTESQNRWFDYGVRYFLELVVAIIIVSMPSVAVAAPTVNITSPTGNSEYDYGEYVYFQGGAIDDDGEEITGSGLVWTSNLSGQIGTGTSFSTPELDYGRHTITLTATDDDGVSAGTSIVIIVNNSAPECAITNPADGSSFDGGQEVNFAGWGEDEEDGTLSGDNLVWTSDKDGRIGIGTSFSTTELSSGTHVITLIATDSEGDTNEDTQRITIYIGNHPPEADILSPSSNSEYDYGDSIAFEGEGIDDEDGTLTGTSLEWTSSIDGEIGIGQSFTVSNLSIGVHTITLTVTDEDGETDSDYITIEVKNTPPTCSITSPEDNESFFVGETVSLVGYAQDEEDSTLDESAYVWRSSIDGQIGIGSSMTIATLSEGTHTITLTVTDTGDDTCTSTITIVIGNEAPAAYITTPESGSTFDMGDTVSFTGYAEDVEDDEDGNSITGDDLVWTSSLDGRIGTGEGFSTTTLSVGLHVITLTATDSQGDTGTAQITITIHNNEPTATITSPADGSEFASGATITFTGEAADEEDTVISGGSFSWSSNIDGEVGTGYTVTCDDLSDGVHEITLTITDSQGETATDSITVIVGNNSPVASITSPDSGTSFDEGETITFAGEASDTEDGNLSGSSLVWYSNKDGSLGTGRILYAASLSEGTHAITLTATDSLGSTGSAAIVIRVGETAPIVTITSPADGSEFDLEEEILLRGAAEDDQDGTLTGGSLVWSSSRDGDLGTGTALIVDNLSGGEHVITLTATDSDGDSETARITITINNDEPEVNIIAPAAGSEYALGDTISFSGTADDSEDGWLTGENLVWSSSRDGELGGGTTLELSSLSKGTHIITLKATDSQGDEGEAGITLNIGNSHPTAAITSPADGSVFDEDEIITFTGSGSDDEDGILTGDNLYWSSNKDGGLGSGTSLSAQVLTGGTHIITLTATDKNGGQGQASITIVTGNNDPEVTITSPAGGDSFDLGEDIIFTGTADDAEDGELSGDALVWTSDRDGEIGTGTALTLDSLSAGLHVITLTATDGDNGSAQKQVIIEIVNQSPEVRILSPSDLSDYTSGSQITFTGYADDEEDGELSGDALVWTSHIDGELGTGAQLTVSGLSSGTHTITLAATDSAGEDTSTSITIYVGNSAPGITITSPAGGSAFTLSEYITFEGSGYDAEDGALQDEDLVWSSNRDGGLGQGSELVVSGFSQGRHTITLSGSDASGALGRATIEISVGDISPEAVITSPSDGSGYDLDEEIYFSGTGKDSEDGDLEGSSLVWSSDKDGQLGTGTSFSLDNLSAGMHIIRLIVTDSEGESTVAEVTITINNEAPTAVILSPETLSSFTGGSTIQFIGQGTDDEDGTLSGSALVWTSSLDGTIGAGGSLSTVLSNGVHVITLIATDSSGEESERSEITVNVGNNPPVATISAPTDTEFDDDDTITFMGSAYDDEEGQLGDDNLEWISSRDGEIGQGSTFTTGALSSGRHVIMLRATDSMGARGTATITITVGNADPEVSIAEPQDADQINADEEIVFRGTASDAEDGELSGSALVWTSSIDGELGSGTAISVSNLSPGKHIITLTATDSYGGEGFAQIYIEILNCEPTCEIISPVDGGRYTQSQTIVFNGSGRDEEDGTLSGSSLVWSSHLDGVFGYGSTVAVSFLSRGTHVITLTALDVYEEEGKATITITIGNDAPEVTITSPANSAGYDEGEIVTFRGSASDEEDGTLTGNALVWTSNIDGEIGRGTSFTTSSLSSGTHTVTLTATDSDGEEGYTEVTINIAGSENAPVATISKPGDQDVYEDGETITFEGSGWDEDDGWLSGSSLVWTSSIDGLIGTGTRFETSALSEGQHVVTLTVTNSYGISRNTSVTVTAGEVPPAITILDPEDSEEFYPGDEITFQAVAYDEDGDILVGASYVWTSDRDGELGSGSLLEIDTLSEGTHLITVQVTDSDGIEAKETLNISVGSLVEAGSSRSVNEGDTVILDGSESLENTDGEGSYTWTQISGPSVDLAGKSSVQATFTAPFVGTSGTVLVFRLTVSDSDGNSDSDEVTITVNDTDSIAFEEDVISFTTATDKTLGISFGDAAEGNVEVYNSLSDAGETINSSYEPTDRIYGYMKVSMELSADSSRAVAVLYLTEAIPDDYKVYIYSFEDDEWGEFDEYDTIDSDEEGAEFNSRRTVITFYLDDNGDYDSDPFSKYVDALICVASDDDGVVSSEEYSSGDSGSGGCLISSAGDSSISAGQQCVSYQLSIMLILLVILLGVIPARSEQDME